MEGVLVKLLGSGPFDYSSHIHNGDDVAGELDDGKVVGNEEVSQTELGLEALKQI
jgi:hypothetical protein